LADDADAEERWWELFYSRASGASNNFNSLLSKYQSFLEPSDIAVVQAVEANPITKIALLRLPEIVDHNKALGHIWADYIFAGTEESVNDYKQFVDNVYRLRKSFPES
jgi:hypothetical protein